MSANLLGIFLVLFSVVVEGLAQVALKKAAVIVGHPTEHRLFAGLGIGLTAVETILWTAALRFLDLSIAFPMGALSFVTSAVFCNLFLREKIVWQRWAGMAVIVLGTACFGME